MPSAGVFFDFLALVVLPVSGHIDFTADDGLDHVFFRLILVFLGDVIEEFLDPEHATMVGQGDGSHAVTVCFVHQTRNGGLSVKDGIL